MEAGAAAHKEASEDFTRQYLIGISNSLPEKIVGEKDLPEETHGAGKLSPVSGKDGEDRRSELNSISYDQSPEGLVLPVAPGRP